LSRVLALRRRLFGQNAKLYEAYVGGLVAASRPQLERAVRESETCLSLALPNEVVSTRACEVARRDAPGSDPNCRTDHLEPLGSATLIPLPNSGLTLPCKPTCYGC
jgi:hypothetical protein